MEILLELNQKYGTGYQVHLLHGPVDSVMDVEPFTLYDAAQGAQIAVDEINKAMQTDYKLWECMKITDEALQANKSRDFASAQLFQDIKTGRHKLTQPKPTYDIMKRDVDGEEEILFTGRGVVLFCFLTWVDEKNAKSKLFLQRYCNLIAMRGYGKGASEILAEVLAMGKDEGVDWVRDTYDKYIHDDMEAMQIMQGLIERGKQK